MSDHLSSPKALADPACDICDMFAFPSPERPGHLVLAMTVFPRAGASALFSDAILCRFRVRPVSIADKGVKPRFAVASDEEELQFDCSFAAPVMRKGSDELTQQAMYTLPAGETISATVNDRRGALGDGSRMFAGLVSDPFIFQFDWILETLKAGRLPDPKVGAGTMDGANCLGLLLEIDVEKMLTGGPLFGIVAETLAIGKRPVRLERVGRPEIKNIAMQWNGYDTVNRDVDLRELYNQEDAFHLEKTYLGAYQARLNANLEFYDGLDGTIDWPPDTDGNHPLTDFLLEDFLVVDVSKPFVEVSYFEIEQAMFDRRTHTTCGGRGLNDDFLDTYYTVLVNAGKGPRIRDGVDQASVPAARAFPYFAPPNPPHRKAAKGTVQEAADAVLR